MDQNSLEYFYLYPIQNGFLTFTVGALFIFTVYHLSLFFQQKDKIYLLYSGYTFFIILSQIRHFREGFVYELFASVPAVTEYPMVYTEVYYGIYVLFALKFLDIRDEFPIWNRYIKTALGIIMGCCLILLLIHFFTWDFQLLMDGYLSFTIAMTALGLVIYIPFFRSKNPLKYYMIGGSMILLIFSVISLAIYRYLGEKGVSMEPSFSILYLGFLLENMVFSLGLGQKQKQILDERNQSQERLINQLRENEALRIQIQTQLEESVKSIALQAETEKLKGEKVSYDKELAEMKLLALRSQMNPHFIFNSLNSIKSYIIENEREEAVYYLNKFAKLIRRILASTREKESTLEQELETMELYVNIENLRFKEKIHFSILGKEQIDLTKIYIPSLLLQPFVENAIWHGLSPSHKEKTLQIKLSAESKDFLSIEILDNGVGLPSENQPKKQKLHKGDSIGISLSKERLRHFSKKYENEGSIQIINRKEIKSWKTGVLVAIQIPIQAKT